jgi:hypothetical protein
MITPGQRGSASPRAASVQNWVEDAPFEEDARHLEDRDLAVSNNIGEKSEVSDV